MSNLTKPNSEQQKDLVIQELRIQNTELKTRILELTKELPTDLSTRKKQFEKDIHNDKKTKDFIWQAI